MIRKLLPNDFSEFLNNKKHRLFSLCFLFILAFEKARTYFLTVTK